MVCDPIKSKATKVADHIQFLSERRFIINPISDPPSQHFNKRASIYRREKKTMEHSLIRVSRIKLN